MKENVFNKAVFATDRLDLHSPVFIGINTKCKNELPSPGLS